MADTGAFSANGAGGLLAGILNRFAAPVLSAEPEPDTPPTTAPDVVALAAPAPVEVITPPYYADVPPPGVRIWFVDRTWHAVAPDSPELYAWYWEGGRADVYLRGKQPPYLTVATVADAPPAAYLTHTRLRHCKGAETVVRKAQDKNGRDQLKAKCGACGKFIKFAAASDAFLQWRAGAPEGAVSQ
jgi:hypothetical protein